MKYILISLMFSLSTLTFGNSVRIVMNGNIKQRCPELDTTLTNLSFYADSVKTVHFDYDEGHIDHEMVWLYWHDNHRDRYDRDLDKFWNLGHKIRWHLEMTQRVYFEYEGTFFQKFIPEKSWHAILLEKRFIKEIIYD